MKRHYKNGIKKVFVLFCILCLFLFESCTDSKPVTQPSKEQSQEQSQETSPAANSEPSIQQRLNQEDTGITATCPLCSGSGICPTCHGQGKSYIADGTYMECTGCLGSGICWYCNGTGSSPFN